MLKFNCLFWCPSIKDRAYTFRPLQAHKGPVLASPNGLIWSMYSDSISADKKTSEVMADKSQSIKDLARFVKQGVVTLKNKVAIVAEGCDNGNYIPLLKEQLFPQLQIEVAIFTTDMSDKMANEVAAPLAHATFGEKALYYSGKCNAFQGPPSELEKFQDWQKLFLAFRMGVVGCREETVSYLRKRKDILKSGGGGYIILHTLADSERNLTSLIQEASYGRESKLVEKKFWKEISPDGNYIEIVRFISSDLLKLSNKHLEEINNDETRKIIKSPIRRFDDTTMELPPKNRTTKLPVLVFS